MGVWIKSWVGVRFFLMKSDVEEEVGYGCYFKRWIVSFIDWGKRKSFMVGRWRFLNVKNGFVYK